MRRASEIGTAFRCCGTDRVVAKFGLTLVLALEEDTQSGPRRMERFIVRR